MDSHHQQQLDYLRHATEDKEAILEEEASLRAEAAELMEVAKKELVANTRAVTLANASPQERARLEAMDEESRMDVLDEMATLAMPAAIFCASIVDSLTNKKKSSCFHCSLLKKEIEVLLMRSVDSFVHFTSN